MSLEGVFTPVSMVTLSHVPLATQYSNVAEKLPIDPAQQSVHTMPQLLVKMSGSAGVGRDRIPDLAPTGPSLALLIILDALKFELE